MKQVKIGVAIPCYCGHVSKLYNLLNSINSQTIVPDKVVVSSSSTDKIEITDSYNFPLHIITTPDKKSAAQNRNIAINNLTDIDYVTFIDADDIMHPQRIEALLYTIYKYDVDIILHNYQIEPYNENKYNIFKYIDIENINVRTDSLVQSWSGCITHISKYSDVIDKIHHSQATVKIWVLNEVKFPEETEFNRKEDSVFCHRVFSLPNIKHAYIQNELSYYNPSNTGGIS